MSVAACISSTYEEVRHFSYKVATNDNVDVFLDNLILLQQYLVEDSKKLDHIVSLVEKLTWLEVLDESELLMLHDTIAQLAHLHRILIRQWAHVNHLKTKGVFVKEINSFKLAIDDINEAISDLKSRFFVFPNNAEFQQTTERLKGL